jgi:hypothetical protein
MGHKVKFRFNWAQKELYEGLHTSNIILKARQVGITTFFALLLLDSVLWGDHIQCGVIAQTMDDATNIFKDKLKFAFDNLTPAIRQLFRCVGDSATELALSHHSSIRVGVSLRSSTLQHLHISEFGKICAKNPDKAREIVTGSLNTVHAGQFIYIESTAEGKQGAFYELCKQAQEHKGPLTKQDYKFFFFPWWKEPEYTQGVEAEISSELQEYFDKLYLDGLALTLPQKWWYANKYKTQREDMAREYPSTPSEAFSSSQEGYWYAKEMKSLYDEGHICTLSYDKALLVHTAWDLGARDATAIWFFQLNRNGEVNVIDYYQKSSTNLSETFKALTSKPYAYGTHLWPHDAYANDRAGNTFVQQAALFNLYGLVLPRTPFLMGINNVRITLSRCWFDRVKCAIGLRALEGYKKMWSSSIGGWTSSASHDECSHGADAMRYLCEGIKNVENLNNDQDRVALNKYFMG